MKYLVTGGCGFIGSHLVDALHQYGHRVRIMDDLSSGTVDYKPCGVELIQGDIANPAIVADAMYGVDGCFHLAAVASVERCTFDPVSSHCTNLNGTVTVFDAARCGLRPVVYASSAATYGDIRQTPLREDMQVQPISNYGADKLACELHASIASRVQGVSSCGLRFFNVYGPRQNPSSPYSGVITIFGNQLRTGQPLTINGDGQNTRDFIFVGDIVNALIAAMGRCLTGNVCDVLNVSTGVGTSILDLARIMGAKKADLHFGPPRVGDPLHSIGDPTKARQILGFCAATDLNTGLPQIFGKPSLQFA